VCVCVSGLCDAGHPLVLLPQFRAKWSGFAHSPQRMCVCAPCDSLAQCVSCNLQPELHGGCPPARPTSGTTSANGAAAGRPGSAAEGRCRPAIPTWMLPSAASAARLARAGGGGWRTAASGQPARSPHRSARRRKDPCLQSLNDEKCRAYTCCMMAAVRVLSARPLGGCPRRSGMDDGSFRTAIAWVLHNQAGRCDTPTRCREPSPHTRREVSR
jgi:hypothetical protein